MSLPEIDPSTPPENRPTIYVNSRKVCGGEKLKSAVIEHPSLGLTVEVGGHPSNLFAPIAIRTAGIQYYTIYFTVIRGTIIVAMMQTTESATGEKFWELEKIPGDISQISYLIPQVRRDANLADREIPEKDLRIKIVDTPDEPLNLNREIFITDSGSGIRFRMIRLYNMDLKENTPDCTREDYFAKFDPSEKLAERLEANQELFILGATFFNARQAKKLGDGIAKIGIWTLQDLING